MIGLLVSKGGIAKSLLIQLCLSLAAFIVQTTEAQWPNPIENLVNIFGNSTEGRIILLELLIIIPEEFDNTRISVKVNLYITLKKEVFYTRKSEILDANALSVLLLLFNYYSSESKYVLFF